MLTFKKKEQCRRSLSVCLSYWLYSDSFGKAHQIAVLVLASELEGCSQIWKENIYCITCVCIFYKVLIVTFFPWVLQETFLNTRELLRNFTVNTQPQLTCQNTLPHFIPSINLLYVLIHVRINHRHQIVHHADHPPELNACLHVFPMRQNFHTVRGIR